MDKENKVILANVTGALFISLYGLFTWEYGKANLNFHNEGWFSEDTKSGGADKLGHMFSTYAFADLLGETYRDLGYDDAEAAKLSSISSWFLMLLMEIGDSSSPGHGFSYEDLVMNTAGAILSYLLQKYPKLDDILDFRVAFQPGGKYKADIFTNYESTDYIMAIQLNGFETIKNHRYLKPLRFVEFQVGYRARGFDKDTSMVDKKSTEFFVAIGLNIPLGLKEISKKTKSKKLKTVVNTASVISRYFQLPFTSLSSVNF